MVFWVSVISCYVDRRLYYCSLVDFGGGMGGRILTFKYVAALGLVLFTFSFYTMRLLNFFGAK